VYSLARESPDLEAFLSKLHSGAGAAENATMSGTIEAQAQAPGEAGSSHEQQKTDASPVYPKLTKELAHAHAKDGMILVTWSNYHFIDFVDNWIAHLQDAGAHSPCAWLPCASPQGSPARARPQG
jgi:hypothetical protein